MLSAPVLDEGRYLRDLVVEFAGGGVGVLREPVDLVGAACICGCVDGFDEGAADAFAAGVWAGEQVFEIAARAGGHMTGWKR